MRAIIVEDELNVRMGFIKLLQAFCPEITIVGQSENVEESLTLIQRTDFDLLFLDIILPDGSGFDVLHRTTKTDFNTIFVTAYDQYAIDAFKMCAVDYLLKPVSPDRLRQAIDRLSAPYNNFNRQESIDVLQSKLAGDNAASDKIILKDVGSLHIIKVQNILYCSAEGAYSTFTLTDGREITTSTHLKEYERLLEGHQFLRCHHSYLVNLHHITEVRKNDGGMIITTNGNQIPLSIRKRKTVIESLKNRFIS